MIRQVRRRLLGLWQPSRLIALAAAVATACEGDCVGPDQLTVRGRVLVEGAEVPGVLVELEQNGVLIQSTTTVTGIIFNYEFVVAAGPYTVRIVPKPGTHCPTTARQVNGKAGDEVTANFDCFTGFNLNVTAGYDHNTGTAGQSKQCGEATTAEAQLSPSPSRAPGATLAAVIGAGATYTVQVTGPIEGGPSGIVAGQPPIAGVLGADGTARYEVRINRFGTYTDAVTVTSAQGVVRTASANVTVSAAPGTCP